MSEAKVYCERCGGGPRLWGEGRVCGFCLADEALSAWFRRAAAWLYRWLS